MYAMLMLYRKDAMPFVSESVMKEHEERLRNLEKLQHRGRWG